MVFISLVVLTAALTAHCQWSFCDFPTYDIWIQNGHTRKVINRQNRQSIWLSYKPVTTIHHNISYSLGRKTTSTWAMKEICRNVISVVACGCLDKKAISLSNTLNATIKLQDNISVSSYWTNLFHLDITRAFCVLLYFIIIETQVVYWISRSYMAAMTPGYPWRNSMMLFKG